MSILQRRFAMMYCTSHIVFYSKDNDVVALRADMRQEEYLRGLQLTIACFGSVEAGGSELGVE